MHCFIDFFYKMWYTMKDENVCRKGFAANGKGEAL